MDNNEVVRMTMSYTIAAGSVAQNVFYWRLATTGLGVPDVQIMSTLTDWTENEWFTAWSDIGSDTAEIRDIDLAIVNSNGEIKRVIGSTSIGLAGLVGGDPTPAAVSGYIRATTDLTRAAGSKYIPGMAEGQVAAGLFDIEAVADLLFLLAEWLTPILVQAGAELISGVLSKQIDNFVDFNGTGTVSNVPAYQRRRKPQVGS